MNKTLVAYWRRNKTRYSPIIFKFSTNISERSICIPFFL